MPIVIAQTQAYNKKTHWKKKGFTVIDSLSIKTVTHSKNNNNIHDEN